MILTVAKTTAFLWKMVVTCEIERSGGFLGANC